jgi:cytochrome c-type biogenesis protein CcmH/NrfG
MAIEGPLKELSIQDVLQLLELARKTGVLTVRSDLHGDEAIVHFDRGTIVFAVRRRSPRRLGQLLLMAGKLTQRELDAALEIQRQDPSRRLAEVLLEMGSVTEQELEAQLRFQMEETIYELMAWDEGYFRFEERTDVSTQTIVARVRVDSLLMEGARRIDEWTRLESKVPSPEAVASLSPADERETAVLELRPDEWEVLAEVDGEKDLRQIAANVARSTFDIAKIIFGLVSLGVVQVQEKRQRMPEREMYAAVQQVEALIGSGDLEEAARLAGELETANPERAELALLAGRTLAAQGRMRAATEAFTRAVGLDPLSADAHYHLGFAAVRTGELLRAAAAWETFVRISPNGSRRRVVNDALSALLALNEILIKETAT